MIAIPQQLPEMTVEEYLEWEPQQDVRYEYANGEVFAITGSTIPHNDIALNLYTALHPHLRFRGTQMEIIPCDGNDKLSSEQQQTVIDAAKKLLKDG